MKTAQPQAGFTMIELVVAATFMAMAFTSILVIFIATGALDRQARDIALATQAAQEQIEIFRNGGYAQVTIGTTNFSSSLPSNLGSAPRTANAVVTETTPGIKQVDITITYKEGKQSKQVKVSTIITQIGIDR